MRSIQRIIVAVKNPEALTSSALLKAGQLARALDAQLEIFHALSPQPHSGDYGVPHAQVQAFKRKSHAQVVTQLEKIATLLRRRRTKVSVAAEWDFPSYEAIIRRARHIKADLIVAGQGAGNHSLAGLLKLTDWELLRLSPVPVLLIRTSALYRHPIVLAAVDPAHANSKSARLDESILSVGATLTQSLKGRLHALHAFIPFPLIEKPHRPLSPATLARLKAEIGFGGE